MTQTVVPLVKLRVANSYYYDCGMILTNSIELPAEESTIREKLNEIQDEDGDSYIVLNGETQFECVIPENLDIFELNSKLKKLPEEGAETLKVISKLGDYSLMSLVDLALRRKYEIYENVSNEEELGRVLYRADQLPFKIPKVLENFIDYKKVGHDACIRNSIRIIPELNLAERAVS